MRLVIATFAALLLTACPEPRFSGRRECRALAVGLATAEAAHFCPISGGEWDECPDAARIERDLEIALELCDAR